MLESAAIHALFAGLFAALMLWAIVSDARRFELPNSLSLVLLAGFIAMAAVEPLAWRQIGWHLATGTAVFAIGVALFIARLFGGGDTKLLAAIAVWLGPQRFFLFLLLMSLAGGALALALLLFRRLPLPAFFSRWQWLKQMHARTGEVPYGVAMGLAGLAVQAGSLAPA
ncbi:MAG: peptidase [Alphaproteobacteria bacterium]|nr:peptidase [Alphaproteobacteria bacterium]